MKRCVLAFGLILAGITACFADDGVGALLTSIHAPSWVGWVVSFLLGSGLLGAATVVAMAFRDLINHVYNIVEIIKRKFPSLLDNDTKAEINGALDAIMLIMSKVPLPFIKSKIDFVQKMKLKIDAIPSGTVAVLINTPRTTQEPQTGVGTGVQA